MIDFEVGELVHVPGATVLMKYDNSHEDIPVRSLTTGRPVVGVVLGPSAGDCHQYVYCLGEKWSVSSRSLYKIKEEPSD
jgi:hypothetical protein